MTWEEARPEGSRLRSYYDGPEAETAFSFGGTDPDPVRMVVARPADPDRLLEAPEVLSWNRGDDYMPYWAYLWPGAFLLAEAVATASKTWPRSSPVLEIGCGLGLAGLAALVRGMEVTFTDYDPAPLEFVAKSARANGIPPEQYRLSCWDWRFPPERQYPYILGADVLYERRLIPMVCHLLDRLLAPDGVAYVAGPYRVATQDLDPELARCGLVATATPCTADGAPVLGPVRGTLHTITRKT